MDPAPTSVPESTFGLKERCAAVDTMSFVARVLHRSKPHLQSMLLQNNPAIVEDFFVNLVDTVPDLTEHIHRRTARLLLHIDGFIDRIANAKWEVKELGLEHNGYVDLLLEDFKHYRTRLAHGDLYKEVQEQLLDYGVEHVAVTLVEGLSRVKRCTDEGRALMSLDLQVLINGLQHIVLKDVKPKLQVVETFIKVRTGYAV
uniref:Syndetin C-terminal domain-containing protein n=1 Tax=Opuntia streptacantha TaxID=393608 RepID=A0A7C9CXP5_OPUST